MLTLLLVAGGLALGYLAGRVRPARRASAWAWRQIDVRRTPRTSWRWWAAQLVFACEIAAILATRPRETVRAWQHRNAPPPPRSPAPVLRPIEE
ncbi:hypothetical protein [Streptomyces sp. NPDC012888]|uniref:hypothetical protein n=1 Tax=Streptomyces sp. NPDC012888 TaxID=3364855 RepID=UPI00369AE121